MSNTRREDLSRILYLPYVHLEQLFVLTLVVRSGSFSAAAETLLLSQSAVSQRIQQLERTLGAQLLNRAGRRGIQPTEAGIDVLAFAEETIAQFENLHKKLRNATVQSRLPHTVRIASTSGALRYLLPTLVRRAREEMPDLNVVLLQQSPDETEDLLLKGEAELGIRAGSVDTAAFEKVLILLDELVIVGPPSVVSSITSRCQPVESHPFILPNYRSGIRSLFNQWATDQGIHPTVHLEANDVDMRANGAIDGAALTVIPRYVVEDRIESGQLAILPTSVFPLKWPIFLVHPKSMTLSQPIERFLSFVVSDRQAGANY